MEAKRETFHCPATDATEQNRTSAGKKNSASGRRTANPSRGKNMKLLCQWQKSSKKLLRWEKSKSEIQGLFSGVCQLTLPQLHGDAWLSVLWPKNNVRSN